MSMIAINQQLISKRQVSELVAEFGDIVGKRALVRPATPPLSTRP